MRRFGDYADAFASGWMMLRGTRRRRGVDRGFVLSDHADWPGLLWAIEQTGAERVMVTTAPLRCWCATCAKCAASMPRPSPPNTAKRTIRDGGHRMIEGHAAFPWRGDRRSGGAA